MGQSLRATLSGDYQSGDSSDSATGPADANEGFVSTNGQFVESLSPSRIVSAQLHSTFDTWSMGLTVQSDFPIRGGVLIVTPNLSLFGGQTTLNHEYAQVIIRDVPARRRQPAATILTGTYNLSEDLENDFYGGSVGADLSFKATPDLIFFVGGKIGASYDDARLRSRDSCATLNGLTQCGDAPPDSGFATSASDARTRLGFVAGARVGLVYNFKYFIVALVGWGEYDSDVPSVRNATRSDPSPTSITFDDQWEWGGRITVTVPLNHLFRRGA
jgi:hypothetical protein